MLVCWLTIVMLSVFQNPYGYQKFLYLCGLLSIAAGLFHVVIWLFSGEPWAGPVSWRKPIVFGLSGGITTITLAWIFGLLTRSRVAGWVFAMFGPIMIAEIGLVTLQKWRGVPSHFNLSSAFDSGVFSAMGAMIVVIQIYILVMTLWSFLALKDVEPGLRWAIRIGLVFLLASQGLGNLIIANGIQKVLEAMSGQPIEEATRTAAVYGAAGAMKLPHAMTLHAIQVLPLLALLLGSSITDASKQLRLVLLAAAGYTGLVSCMVWQTFNGLAPLDMDMPILATVALSLILLVVPFAAAFSGSLRPAPTGE